MKEKRFLRQSAAALAVLTGACVLGACAAPSPESQGGTPPSSAAGAAPEAPAGDGEAVTIWAFAEPHARYFEWVTQEFQKTHPELSFGVELMDGNALQDRLAVIISSGGEGSPDFVDVEQGAFPNYMSDDKMCFEPLNPYIQRDGVLDKMVESRLSLYRYKDTYYGLEHALCPVTMAYRPDLFEQCGLSVPETWDDFMAAAQVFKQNGIYITTIPDMNMGDFADDIALILRGAGKDYVDKDGNLSLTPEFKRVVTDFWQLQSEGMAFGFETEEDKWLQYRDNKAAVYFTPDWAAGWLRDNVPEQSGQWSMAPLPRLTPDALPTSCRGGTGLAMMSYTQKDKELLWEFMKFSQVDRDNCVKKYEMINLYPPVYEAMPLCNAPVEYYGGQDLGAMYEELSQQMPAQNQAPWRSRFIESLKANAFDFCQGNVDIEGLCQQLTDDVNDYIANMG